jgi:hypothetical protein
MGRAAPRRDIDKTKAPYTFTEDALTDGTDVEQKIRLYNDSAPYPNLAGDPEIAERAKQAVMGSIETTFSVMEFLRNKWLLLYRLWRGESLDQSNYGRTTLHSPEPFKIVETLQPRIMRTLFGSDRWFKLYSEDGDSDSNAKAQEALCRHQLRKTGFASKVETFIRDGLIYGSAAQKCYWRQEIGEMRYREARRIPSKTPGLADVELSEVQRKELIFDGNEISTIEIFDLLAPPNAGSVDEAEWMADRSAWSDYRVKQMVELGHWTNCEALRDHPGSGDTSFGDEFKERKAYAYGVFDPREASWASHVPHYEVIDWWGPLVVRKSNGSYETKQVNIVVIEPKSLGLVVRVAENPFWHKKKPYQVWRPIQVKNEFFGVGALEMIARMSLEKDMKRNLLMASTQLEGNPMMAVSDEANIPDGQFIAQPGLIVRVPGDPSRAIAPVHVPQVSDAALKAENVLTKDIRETAGATSPTMGAADPFSKGKTATQHMAEIDESNIRLVPMINAYENDVMLPMLDQMAWNNMQFQSYSKVIREVGPMGMFFNDRVTITPQDLIGRFIVQPLASHRLTTKQTQVQQLVNILDRAPVINQMYGPDAVKMPQLLAMILEFGFDIRNVDEFISTTAEDELLTPDQEHALWMRGHIPPIKKGENLKRHADAHMQFLGSEDFAYLEEKSPGTAGRVRSHIAETLQRLERLQMRQENALMEAAQQGAIQQAMQGPGGGGGPGSPVAGAAGPGQDPDSPNIRRNETERNDGGGEGPKSEAMRGAPNKGAE